MKLAQLRLKGTPEPRLGPYVTTRAAIVSVSSEGVPTAFLTLES